MPCSARESRIEKRIFVTKTAIKTGYTYNYPNRNYNTTTFLHDIKFMLKIEIQVKFVLSDLYLHILH